MKPKPDSTSSTEIILTDLGQFREMITLSHASRETGLHRELIIELSRASLIHPLPASPRQEEPVFDEQALCRLRQIAELRDRQHVNLRTIKLIVKLMDRLEAAETELRFLRERTPPGDLR